jgi:CRISPR-associated protein Csb1
MSDVKPDGVKPDIYDLLLGDDGPAAILFTRRLIPVEGKGAWIFPATFAQSESDDDDGESKGDYQINDLPDDPRKNVCDVDSVGSQGNRFEPIFKKSEYSKLVPQYVVPLKKDAEGTVIDSVNLLDAGHRAADAVVRFTKQLGPRLFEAFKIYRDKHDASQLIEIAPTSIVFGVWDSRGTGAKIQRIVRSAIRAYNVVRAKRSATYQAAYDYVGSELINSELDKGSGKTNPLSQEGFKYSLATDTHGGVSVRGEIQQEAIINLVALRTVTEDLKSRRYLLALSLIALSFRDQTTFNLREGCLLRCDSKNDLDGNWSVIAFDGEVQASALPNPTHDQFKRYAEAVTADGEFQVKQPSEEDANKEEFDKETAEAYVAIDKKKRKKLSKRMHPSEAVKMKKGADPVEGLRKLVDGLSIAKDKFKSTKPRKALDERLKAISEDADSSEGLKILATKISTLFNDDIGAEYCKAEMLRLFQAEVAAQPGAAPADATPVPPPEIPQ